LQFAGVFDLTAFGQDVFGLVSAEPRGIARGLFRTFLAPDFEQKALITYSRTPGGFQKTPLEWM